MSEEKQFILATAGHVDHGKSALIKALTGVDPDRLPEEKARGITIDLGFAHIKLSSPPPDSTSFLVGIVDVPGHEDFVKNMVGGVGSIDLVLFVVAADDWWMPQTEEHLHILTYLGVPRAVIALTKIDLVQNEELAIESIREKLRGTPFSDAPIVPTSLVTGRGLDLLKATLAEQFAAMSPPRDFGKPRLPVDRVFTLHGIGTVVTGTLTGGKLKRGQTVVVQPAGISTRVRNIQCYGDNVETSGPGTRTALNLPDLTSSEFIGRGDVITLGEFGRPSKTLDVLLEISPRATRILKNSTRAWLHYGSGSVAARILFLDVKQLAPGEKAMAQLRLEAPAFVFTDDRCILRDWAEQHTLAGATVLDPDADRKAIRSPARVKFLQQRAEFSADPLIFIESQIVRDGAVRRSSLLLKSRFSEQDISDAIEQLRTEHKVVVAGDVVIEGNKWNLLRQRAADVINARHREHPEHLGLPLTDLRVALADKLPVAESFDALISDLCSGEFVQSSGVIRRGTHQAALPEKLQSAGAKIRAALAVNPFDPPSRNSLTPDPTSNRALRFLIDTAEVVEVGSELVMTAEGLTRAADIIRRHIEKHGPATVSELRQALGSSRRVVVPLLERLDRQGVTARLGEKRILRR